MTLLGDLETLEPPKPKAGKRATTTAKVRTKLEDFFTSIGLAVSAFDETCGPEIVERAEQLADSWAKVADEHPAVRRFLESTGTLGVWTEALAVTGGLAWAIIKHHSPTAEALGDIADVPEDVEGEGESIASMFAKLREGHKSSIAVDVPVHEYEADEQSGRCKAEFNGERCGHPSPSPIHARPGG